MFFFAILFGFVALSSSYTMLVPAESGKSKDHEGYCFYKTLIKVNESTFLPNCEQAFCLNDYAVEIVG